jgi:hypothetical protein
VVNSPFKYIDPEGMDVWIKLTSGSGKNKTTTYVRYENGKLYGKDGKEYTSGEGFNKKGEMAGFLKKAYSSLEKIRSTEKGGEMLSDLQKGSAEEGGLTTIISEGRKNNSKHTSANGGGKFTHVSWSGSASMQAADINNNIYYISPEAGLTHELAHAWDNKLGTLDASTVIGTAGNGDPVYAAEYFATYIENRVSEALDGPIRGYYGITFNTDMYGQRASGDYGIVPVFDNAKKLHIKSTKGGIAQYYPYQFK